MSSDSLEIQFIAEKLTELTGVEGIVSACLHGLTQLLSRTGLAANAYRFCPLCYAGDLFPLYGRVLWEFQAVKACPEHGVKLVEHVCGASEGDRLRRSEMPLLYGV